MIAADWLFATRGHIINRGADQGSNLVPSDSGFNPPGPLPGRLASARSQQLSGEVAAAACYRGSVVLCLASPVCERQAEPGVGACLTAPSGRCCGEFELTAPLSGVRWSYLLGVYILHLLSTLLSLDS